MANRYFIPILLIVGSTCLLCRAAEAAVAPPRTFGVELTVSPSPPVVGQDVRIVATPTVVVSSSSSPTPTPSPTPVSGIPIFFSVDGVNTKGPVPVSTEADGTAPFKYSSEVPGQDVVTAFPDVNRDGEQEENEEVGSLTLQWESPEVVVTASGASVTPPPGAPRIALRPDSANPGESLMVHGQGWSSNGLAVHLTLQAEDGSPIGSGVTVRRISSDGSFHRRVPVPDVDPGPYTVVACQGCGPTGKPATAAFTILAPSSVPWGWVVAGLLLAAVATGTALWRRRARRTGADQRVQCTTSMEPAAVELLVAPDDAAHHSIRLVPRDGSGRHEVEELIDA